MTSTILDTRKYEADRKRLYLSAKKAIAGQGWSIREDINDALIAMIRAVDGLKKTSFTVTISGRNVLVKCGPGCKAVDYDRNREAVDRFFRSLEETLGMVREKAG